MNALPGNRKQSRSGIIAILCILVLPESIGEPEGQHSSRLQGMPGIPPVAHRAFSHSAHPHGGPHFNCAFQAETGCVIRQFLDAHLADPSNHRVSDSLRLRGSLDKG